MKFISKILLLALILMISIPAWSQIDLIRKAKQKTEKEVDKKVDDNLDKLFGNKKKDKSEGSTEGEATVQPATMSEESAAGAGSETGGTATKSPTGVRNWAKYDFVPGDELEVRQSRPLIKTLRYEWS